MSFTERMVDCRAIESSGAPHVGVVRLLYNVWIPVLVDGLIWQPIQLRDGKTDGIVAFSSAEMAWAYLRNHWQAKQEARG